MVGKAVVKVEGVVEGKQAAERELEARGVVAAQMQARLDRADKVVGEVSAAFEKASGDLVSNG